MHAILTSERKLSNESGSTDAGGNPMLARLGDVKLGIEMLATPSGAPSVCVPLAGANAADISQV